jgi:serine/threonine protein kinase
VTAPLTITECDLLEAVAQREAGALEVLGDYWSTHVDEARGAFVMLDAGANAQRIELADEEARLAEHAARWREPLIRAGYCESHLAFDGGFLQWPLCVPAGDALDGDPTTVRLSPLYFRERGELRRGTQFTVIEAEAITPRTRVRAALKTPTNPDPESIEILDEELAILRSIDHPNVIRPYGIAIRQNGMRAIAMPWAGIDLRRLLRMLRDHAQALGIDVVLSIAVQLLDALRAVHAAGLVHREVRSDHVALAADGTVRLLDFGTTGSRYVSPGYRGDLRFRITYMSPEQARGFAIDARSDVFSAAGLIAELATHVHPLAQEAAPTDFALLARLVQETVTLPPGLPASLCLALAPAIERNRERRPSASALQQTLVAVARQMRLELGPHVIARRLVELGVPA